MKLLFASAVAGAMLMLFLTRSPSAPQTVQMPAVHNLCTSYVGPAFIIPDQSRATIVTHAGASLGVSFLSLETGRVEGFIPIQQPVLAASMPSDTGVLALALTDGSGVRVSHFDIASRNQTSSVFLDRLDAQIAVFAPNRKYLLGVTTTGTIFKVDLAAGKYAVTSERAVTRAASLAVSPDSRKLYVAGDGLAVIDIKHMNIESLLTEEKRLLEVAISPDGNHLILRNWRDIELIDLARTWSDGVSASVLVDPIPNSASVSSTSRLAFSPNASTLFYIRASDSDSELITLSVNPLQIVTRTKIGAYPNAIAALNDRIFFAAGFSGDEQLEAINPVSHAIIFKTPLADRRPAPSESTIGCSRTPNAI